MNAAVALIVDPLIAKVAAAEEALDRSNRDPDAHPYEALALAGYLIKAQEELIARVLLLLDRRDPDEAECQCEATLRLQGRLRRLAELHERQNTA